MKNLILIFAAVFSLISVSASAVSVDNVSAEQQIENLQSEVHMLRQIIMQSQKAHNNNQHNNQPQCLVTGERCSSAYDVCCNSGRYCGNAGGICP